jgi:hypothetical protein
MSPPAGHCHYSREFLLYTTIYLGLLLHRDADLYPFTFRAPLLDVAIAPVMAVEWWERLIVQWEEKLAKDLT